jgi:uncharacterized protein (DUF362 family)/NAD-dependent dihydropyrimidine dehydrogenase PreA subunit
MNTTVSVVPCHNYEMDAVRQALRACLAPLGGIEHFVRPGMRVLLKPNLLAAAELEQAVTTHPAIVQAVAELAINAGGVVQIGDSPAGPVKDNPSIWRKSGMPAAAEQSGASLVLFDGVNWQRHNGADYLIARPVSEADLVINLPKIKTHMLTLYTGAIKNLLGVVPGTHKTEMHIRAIGIQDFSRELVNLLEIVRPGLTIMDGVWGLEGAGPGAGGTPHHYGCLSASADPVALDTVITRAMGYPAGAVLHVAQAGERRLGVSDPALIQIVGPAGVLEFGRLALPASHWYLRAPAWISAPIQGQIKLTPRFDPARCNGCAKCVQVCAGKALAAAKHPGGSNSKPPALDKKLCISCMCCAEVCPQGAIEPARSRLGQMIGL